IDSWRPRPSGPLGVIGSAMRAEGRPGRIVKLASYWLDTAPRFTRGMEGRVEGPVDVAVIGGGFTGLSAAPALAKRGASVAVLEAGRVVGEASGRNGGHCNNGLAHDVVGLAERLGLDRTRALYRAYDAAVDSVETIVREEAVDCDFKRTGKIKLAAKPAHFASLQRSYDLLKREIDADTALVPPAEIRSEIGSDRVHGGLVQRRGGHMHVGRCGVGLAEAAAKHGARIYENAAVTALRRVGRELHRLTTERGGLEAKQVLVATGASRRGPFFYFRRRIVPVG